jgi:hypothetical protein
MQSITGPARPNPSHPYNQPMNNSCLCSAYKHANPPAESCC